MALGDQPTGSAWGHPTDILIAPDSALARQWNRSAALAAPQGAFACTAVPFDDWVAKLWEMAGDGRRPADGLQQAVAAELVAQRHGFEYLRPSPGLGRTIVECARQGLGVPAFDAAVEAARQGMAPEGELTLQEQELLSCVGEYEEALAQAGLAVQGTMLRYLAAQGREALGAPAVARMLGERPLTGQQQAFFQGCGGLTLVHDEQLEPPPLGSVEGVSVAAAFPAGPSAQPQLLLDIIGDLLRDDPGASIVVAAADPQGLFRKLGPALAQGGVGCAGIFPVAASATQLGRALAASVEALGPQDAWDGDAFTDGLRSAVLGAQDEALWGLDARLRGDRLAERAQVLAALLEGEGSEALGHPVAALEQLARFCEEDLEDGPLAQAVGRLRSGTAFACEQQGALAVAAALAHEGRSLGPVSPEALLRLFARTSLQMSVRLGPGASDQEPGMVPTVRIMDRRHAAQLGPGEADALILCDLTTASYPLREPRSAARKVLDVLGAGPRETALGQARREFRALLEVPASSLVLERCLNDAKADPLYPCAMLEELARAHGGGPDQDDAGPHGLPAALAGRCYERGEECLELDVRPVLGADAAPAQEAPAPCRESLAGVAAGAEALVRVRGASGLPCLSPSQIERYLECPYGWLIGGRLGTDELDEGLGPREAGTFLHGVFQRFYQRFGRKVTAQNLSQAQVLMFGEDGLGGLFAEAVEAQYGHDGQGRPLSGRLAVRPGTSEESEWALLRHRVARWLLFETEFLPGFTPCAFECRIDGMPYGGCELRGIIDRIDVDDRGRVVVIDYKGALRPEHAAGGPDGFSDEAKVQALMYARVVQQAGAIAFAPQDDPDHPGGAFIPAGSLAQAPAERSVAVSRVLGALYLSYNAGNAVTGAFDRTALGPQALPTLTMAQQSAFPVGEGAGFPELLDHTEQRVARAVEGILAGNVAPDPHTRGACAYCPVLACPRRLP